MPTAPKKPARKKTAAKTKAKRKAPARGKDAEAKLKEGFGANVKALKKTKAAGKNKGGRPKRLFTLEERKLVELLYGMGVRLEEIGKQLDCSVSTIQRNFKKEMERGQGVANAAVAKSLFMLATGKPSGPMVTAVIWWEKTRAGKSDKVQLNTGPNVKVVIGMPDNGRGDGPGRKQ